MGLLRSRARSKLKEKERSTNLFDEQRNDAGRIILDQFGEEVLHPGDGLVTGRDQVGIPDALGAHQFGGG